MTDKAIKYVRYRSPELRYGRLSQVLHNLGEMSCTNFTTI